MFRRSRKPESWKDLPTKLIQAVGRRIGLKSWEEIEAEQIPNGDELSAEAVYGLLLRCLECWRGQVKVMPLELSPAMPRKFSVKSLARALVRIAILIEDGDKPAKNRKVPEHFAQCPHSQLWLLDYLELFLRDVERHLGGSRRKHGTFYYKLTLPLDMLLHETHPLVPHLVVETATEDLVVGIATEDANLVVGIATEDAELAANFKAIFGEEMIRALQAGEELSAGKLREMARRAATMAGAMTSAPRPDDPSLD